MERISARKDDPAAAEDLSDLSHAHEQRRWQRKCSASLLKPAAWSASKVLRLPRGNEREDKEDRS